MLHLCSESGLGRSNSESRRSKHECPYDPFEIEALEAVNARQHVLAIYHSTTELYGSKWNRIASEVSSFRV